VRYLLDASALIPLTTTLGRGVIETASKHWLATTDLAVYEACNALWKLSALLKAISVEDAVETTTVIRDLTGKDLVHVMSFHKLDLPATLRLAFAEELTFYDASYVVTARDAEAILVTEDHKLRKSAGRRVEAIDFSDFHGKLSRK